VQLMRDFFYTNVSPTPGELLIVFTLSFTTLIIGWLLFARQTEEFVLRT
jgi:ABC-type polysaccharide/polyol phosphate export permease